MLRLHLEGSSACYGVVTVSGSDRNGDFRVSTSTLDALKDKRPLLLSTIEPAFLGHLPVTYSLQRLSYPNCPEHMTLSPNIMPPCTVQIANHLYRPSQSQKFSLRKAGRKTVTHRWPENCYLVHVCLQKLQLCTRASFGDCVCRRSVKLTTKIKFT